MTQAPAGLSAAFEARYEDTPRVFCAPGRVNLIGDHTDYNGGFVLPAAIQFSTRVAMRPRNDRVLEVTSENFGETRQFDLNSELHAQRNWSDYVVGVAAAMERSGYHPRGANLMIRGEVPIGAGLSSSASIEVATALALLAAADIAMDGVQIAKLCQRAENEFVGARCGIMDQFISYYGRAGHALLLDCRSLQYRPAPLPSEICLAICNSRVHHNLASGEYNRRRSECEEGVRQLARFLPGISELRDVSLEQLIEFGHALSGTIYRRCRHVITENRRTRQAAAALERGDLDSFGRLMYESHISLRDDFQVSCPELDILVDLASVAPGVYGSRMTGGGFGGCTISLARKEFVEDFREWIEVGYKRATGKTPEIYVSQASDGAREVKPEES